MVVNNLLNILNPLIQLPKIVIDLSEQYFVGIAELLKYDSKLVLFGSPAYGWRKDDFRVRRASDVEEMIYFLFFFHGFVVHMLQIGNIKLHEYIFTDVRLKNLPLKLSHNFLLMKLIFRDDLISD